MQAGKYDIIVEQGATWTRVITYKDDAGAVIDLTDWEARMQVRQDYTSADPPLAEWTSDPVAGITIDGPAGEITIIIEADESQEWDFRQGVYDLELVQPAPGDDVIRLIKGKFTVDPEVTR